MLLAADCAVGGAPTFRAVFVRGTGDSAWGDLSTGLPATRQISGIVVGDSQFALATRENAVYTRNGVGAAWENISLGLPLIANDVVALAAGPANTLYVGLRQLPVLSLFLGGVWRFTPGAGWESLNGSGLGSSIEGIDILALTVASDGTILGFGSDGRVYIGDTRGNGNHTWRAGGSTGRAPLALTLSPSATALPPDSVLFAGTGAGLLRSLTLGRSFDAVNAGLNLAIGVRQLVATLDGTLFAASATRAYRSADGEGWTTVRDLGGGELSALTPSAAYGLDGAVFLAADDASASSFQRSSDRGATWTTAAISETFTMLVSSPQIQRDGTLFAGVEGLVNTSSGGVLSSPDRGLSWFYRNAGLSGRSLHSLAALPSGAFAPLLAGTDDGVYALEVGDEVWNVIDAAAAITEVRALAASTTFATDRVLFAGGPGGLYRYGAENGRWARLDTNLPLADLRALAVSPSFAQDATMVAATGAGTWLSTDGGTSWAKMQEGLPTDDTRTIMFSARFKSDRAVYAGTNAGLYRYTLPPAAPPWLVMLYLAGDDSEPSDPAGALTSLSEPLRLLVERLDSMPYNPAMRLVVLFDGASKGDSRLYVRVPEGLRPASPAPLWFPGDSELDTGSVSTLRNFIRWSLESFPGTRHTFLALVDHGGGWAPDFGDAAQPRARRAQSGGFRGMSIDETSGTELSTRDTGAALRGLGRFDVLFFDACLMGMLESAAEVQPYADYYIAGQNLLWSALPYEQYLAPDALTSTTTPRQLAEQIVARYNQPSPGETTQVEPFVISALDLNRLPVVRERVNTLAEHLLALLPPGQSPVENPAQQAITRAYSESQKFDYDVSLSLDPTDGYVDLADLARALRRPANTISPEVSQAAADLLAGIGRPGGASSLVVATRAVSGTLNPREQPWNFAGANGVSIYLPLGERDIRPTGLPSEPGGPPTLERQLYYYSNCDFGGCGQLAFSADAPAWARLLTRLEPYTPMRDLTRRPLGAPYPLASQVARIFVPLIAGAQ
jgi:hypothetical protein